MMSLQELFLIDITVFVNQLHSAIEARNLMLEKEKLMEIYMCLCARVCAYVSVCLSIAFLIFESMTSPLTLHLALTRKGIAISARAH